MIPLVLPAMPRPQKFPAPHSARRASSLLSVLALLAMAFFPVLAQASESSELQYETDIPKVEGETKAPINQPNDKNNSQANSSSTGEPGSQSEGGKSDADSSSKDSSRGNNPSTGGRGGGGQGGPGNGSTDPVGLSQEATPVSTTSSDGGSSPLVPILIAIAALAAITIGAVVMKQRRQPDGISPASPKAR